VMRARSVMGAVKTSHVSRSIAHSRRIMCARLADTGVPGRQR